MKSALVASLAIAMLAFAPAANAAGISDCVHMAKQVADAISTAQPGQATNDARDQASAGRSFCASQMYAQGVAHYTQALKLLGKG